jgi:hypothetical protein
MTSVMALAALGEEINMCRDITDCCDEQMLIAWSDHSAHASLTKSVIATLRTLTALEECRSLVINVGIKQIVEAMTLTLKPRIDRSPSHCSVDISVI